MPMAAEVVEVMLALFWAADQGDPARHSVVLGLRHFDCVLCHCHSLGAVLKLSRETLVQVLFDSH